MSGYRMLDTLERMSIDDLRSTLDLIRRLNRADLNQWTGMIEFLIQTRGTK